MSDVKDLLLTVSAIAPVARAVIAATLILGIAGLVATLAWRASASTRHAIWLLALTAAVVAAVVPATGANFVVETESIVNGPGVVPFNREVFPPARMTPHEFSMASVPAAPAPTVTDFVLDNANALAIALWLIGVLTIVVRCVAGHIGIARLVARARPMVRDHEWLIDRAARQTGANGRCVVRLSDDIDVPFTIGARKPVVLLPASATTWSNERLRIVLVHELAHVARFDYVAQLVATAACAIYWFNPIVWLAAARLRTEAEQAADDRVLAAGIDGVTYASHLLELARPD